MVFKKLEIEKNQNYEQDNYSATCLDCDWQGSVEEAETDWDGDYDEFRRENIPTKVCPKCDGGVEIN